MKKMINKISVSGLVYESNLKVSDKGYINGKIGIHTSKDSNITNVCELKVIAGPTYGNKAGAKKNPNYNGFKTLMEKGEELNYLTVGENALNVQITGAIGSNYFVPKGKDVDRDNIISSIVNNGSFITLFENKKIENPKATFETDIVITNIMPEMTKATETEPSVETGNYLVKGYIFDYKNTAIEVTYIAKTCEEGLSAAEYFSDLQDSLPIFTKVWGNINGFITVTESIEESAFGTPKKVSFKSTKKEYELTGALVTPYEEGLTEEEFKAALQAREKEIAVALENQTNRNANNANTFNGIDPLKNAGSNINASDIANSFNNLGGSKFTF